MGVRPIVAHDKWLYMVRVGIGNPPTFTRLHLDTGSNIMWTQCAPCRSYFPQLPPLYWPAKSRTYRTLPCNHRLCAGYPCIDNECHYEINFFDDTFTKGFIAAERFTFASNLGGRSEAIDDVAFGCSKESSSNMYPISQAVSGILGLGSDIRSFLMQLGHRAKGRFSYCLVPLEHAGQSYLRFGTDVERIKHAQSTPILPKHELDVYSLELQDLSRRRSIASFATRYFQGTPRWYRRLHHRLGFIGHFHDRKGVRRFGSFFGGVFSEAWSSKDRGSEGHGLGTVLQEAEGVLVLPDSRVSPPRGCFPAEDQEGTICLFVRKGEFTLIAAVLQQNFRMVFDVRKRKLTFAEENCARD